MRAWHPLCPRRYEVDTEPLAQLARDNYGCEVIKCLNPTGVVPPRATHQLRWACQPLEQRRYQVDTGLTCVPLHGLA